ncbi:MAG: hypothetical protein V4633_06440 [Pseudomonadota bacterium]
MTLARSVVPQTYIVQVEALAKSGGGFDFSCYPERVWVGDGAAVLIYQLVEPTPADVVFLLPSVPGIDDGQMSTISISRNGKLMVFSDIDTSYADFKFELNVADKSGTVYAHDPEVINRPDTLQVQGQSA